jgi:predicted transcriptional regulator
VVDKKGSRLIVGDGVKPPTELANRFELYRPTQFGLAVGDRVRITAGGKTKDGERLANGSLLTVQGFNKRGDIIVDHGRIIDRDFGHLTHGYCITSHASQGDTVDKVFVGISSQSLPATNERTAYVALTRGKEQAVVFTDDRTELLKAVSRPDDPMSAMELSESTQQKPNLRNRLTKQLAFARGLGVFGGRNGSTQPGMTKDPMADRGIDDAR